MSYELTCQRCGKEFENPKQIEVHLWEKHDEITNVSINREGFARVVKKFKIKFKPTKKYVKTTI
jgi:hypothetical protein